MLTPRDASGLLHMQATRSPPAGQASSALMGLARNGALLKKQKKGANAPLLLNDQTEGSERFTDGQHENGVVQGRALLAHEGAQSAIATATGRRRFICCKILHQFGRHAIWRNVVTR